MGFQIISFRDNLLLVLNASFVIPLSEFRENRSAADDIARAFGDLNSSMGVTDSLSLDGPFELAYSQFDLNAWNTNTGLVRPGQYGAPPSTVISPRRPHAYFRFCAAPKDPRVLQNGDFVPGTYATTLNDFLAVPSGFAAVGRYALPNPATARFVSTLITYDVPSLVGTVTPNFGQAGGGVEVLFAKGCTHRTGTTVPIAAG